MSYSVAETTYDSVNAVAAHLYDDPALSHGAVKVVDGIATAELLLKGVRCTACCRRIENAFSVTPGVTEVDLNYTARRLTLRYRDRDTRLGTLVDVLRGIGFDAIPWSPAESRTALDAEYRDGLKRLGVAGAFGMQVMTIAVALYLGDATGMEPGMRLFLLRLSLVLTLPVVLYSARPFLTGALSALRHRRAEMDITVSLAITLAFGGSVYAALVGGGAIYLESVCMFVFLLTGARLIELGIRRRANMTIDHLTANEPITAKRVSHPGATMGESVPALRLAAGDFVLVGAGTTVPSDGIIERGTSRFNEAILTGESRPATRTAGSALLAGAINCDDPVWMRVTRPAELSTLSRIGQLADALQREGDPSSPIERFVAGIFILCVLCVATVTALVWLWIDAPRALGITIAVLAVACPCALSLAAPVALSAASSRLIAARMLPASKSALNELATITDVVFDKTGTLTHSSVAVSRIRPWASASDSANETMNILAAAAALEATVQHPLAASIVQLGRSRRAVLPPVDDLVYTPAAGVSGNIAGTQWLVGSAKFLRANGVDTALAERELGGHRAWVGRDGLVVGAFEFDESLRPDAATAVAKLDELSVAVHILSGDDPTRVNSIAAAVGVSDTLAEATPEEKKDYIDSLQRRGARVLMIGDGVNDSPALSLADVSAVVPGATPLATTHADLVLLSEQLERFVDALNVARRTRAVVRQNIAWALAYNTLSIPLAAVGLVPPWLAAVGMSLSSMVVVGNALRLLR